MTVEAGDEAALRIAIVRVMRAMADRGLNRGTSGNVSARLPVGSGEGLLVTPSGVPADALTPESIVRMDAAGEAAPSVTPTAGSMKPSSEWRMHAGLYAARGDVNAVVHCHSRYATILACAGRPIPPLHYMVGVSGRSSVAVAPYATFGTEHLAQGVAATLDGAYACLMANHGQIAVGATLERALAVAEEIEEQAAVYWGTLAIGGPRLLDGAQMAEVATMFGSYGQGR